MMKEGNVKKFRNVLAKIEFKILKEKKKLNERIFSSIVLLFKCHFIWCKNSKILNVNYFSTIIQNISPADHFNDGF